MNNYYTVMISKLNNEYLEIEVSSQGAELCSVKEKTHQRQWLWTGDANWWPRHAPVLFPVVGKLKDQQYSYDGMTFTLPQHGFARDREHILFAETENTLTFKLTEDETSLKNFPRPFELYTTYKLEENGVTTAWMVKNSGNKELLFSIGGHPGFLCPLDEEDRLEDYQIIFETEEEPVRWMLEDGLVSGRMPFGKVKNLALSEALFSRDALIFSELKSGYVLLKSGKRSEYIQFDFGNTPFLAFWKKPDAPFICIEPWYGIADHIDHSGRFEEKIGIEKLRSGETFQCSYTITIHSK